MTVLGCTEKLVRESRAPVCSSATIGSIVIGPSCRLGSTFRELPEQEQQRDERRMAIVSGPVNSARNSLWSYLRCM